MYVYMYMYTHTLNECGSFSLARPLFLPTNYESFLLLLKLLINRSAIGGSPGLVMPLCPIPPTPLSLADTYIRPC